MKISKYLQQQKDNGYLPKAQLRRYSSALKLSNQELSKMTGLSASSISVMKSYSAVGQKFRKQHAEKIVKALGNSGVDHSAFESDIKSRNFLIEYDESCWDKRIGVAKSFMSMEEYDIFLDKYLRDNSLRLMTSSFATQKVVVSLIEVALATSVEPLEVLMSIKQEYHNGADPTSLIKEDRRVFEPEEQDLDDSEELDADDDWGEE